MGRREREARQREKDKVEAEGLRPKLTKRRKTTTTTTTKGMGKCDKGEHGFFSLAFAEYEKRGNETNERTWIRKSIKPWFQKRFCEPAVYRV